MGSVNENATGEFSNQQGITQLLDVLISTLNSFFLSPILLIISIAIKLDSPGRLSFLNHCVGKDGQPFNEYKFHSMTSGCDEHDHLVEHQREKWLG